MRVGSEAGELDRFRAAITRRFGLFFDDTKLGLLAEVLDRRARASASTVALYLARLDTSGPPAELAELAAQLTIGETYFFRHFDQFRAFVEVALPDRLSARSAGRKLHLLSAGCASGEEPYSLAILWREHAADSGCDVSIQGVDLNPVMLERAAAGLYSSWSLRETPPEVVNRWFVAQGREFLLAAPIRHAVTFAEKNLADQNASLWQPGLYDVVFCRNMLMYLTPDIARALVERMTRALAPGGYLFLGHAETLRGLSQDYHLKHTHGTFYYQRKDGPLRPPSIWPAPKAAPYASTAPPLDIDWTTSWVETVQRASDRINTLTDKKAPVPVPAAPGSSVRTEVAVALELLRDDRYAEALARLGSLPPASACDPDVILLRAALLTHGGELGEAERVCADLIAIDELSAGAHYLFALCRDGAGDRPSAAHHDQIAAHLDPAFAMPRLHLGLMARRAGDRETAQRELGQAVLLLQREDASRLLLFGGGFGRDSLIALCRAELGRLGGNP